MYNSKGQAGNKRIERSPPTHAVFLAAWAGELVKGNGGLDGALVAHGLQALLPLLDLKDLVHNAVDLHLARVKIVNCGRELVDLGEAAQNSDFISD